MTRGKKWGLGLLVVFLGLVIGLVVSAPDILRWYIHDRHPDVTVRGPIQIDQQGVRLQDVQVLRSGLRATLNEVRVDTARNVEVIGGIVDLTIEDDAASTEKVAGGSGVSSLRASGLEVHLIKGTLQATLLDVAVTPEDVCFAQGKLHHPNADAEVTNGCVLRDKTQAFAERVTVPVRLPFQLPKLGLDYELIVDKVTLAKDPDPNIHFGAVTLGPFTTGPGAILPGFTPGMSHIIYTESVQVDHPWVAPTTVDFPSVAIEVEDSLLHSQPGLVFVSVGTADFVVAPLTWTIQGDRPCGDWLDALPRPLPKPMQGMAEHFSGKLKFNVEVKPIPKFEVTQSCKYECSAQPIAQIMNGKQFTYTIYDKRDQLVDRTTGPGTPGWTTIQSLPPHVPEAFRLLEDPGFYSHRGIVPMAFVNSLKANLEQGKFLKGGSTITMQLAKNLWLRREKTIGRKAQEALLTFGLESCLSKEQILELYLNVIEFGPDVYGIDAAAHHYFRKFPSGLTPDEAFYLAGLLPAPRKALPPNAGGLAKAQRLMKGLARSGYISEAFALNDEELNNDADTADWH